MLEQSDQNSIRFYVIIDKRMFDIAYIVYIPTFIKLYWVACNGIIIKIDAQWGLVDSRRKVAA